MLNLVLDNAIFFILHINHYRYYSHFSRINEVPINTILTKIEDYVKSLRVGGDIFNVLLYEYDITPNEFRLTGGIQQNIREIFTFMQNTNLALIEEKKVEFANYKRRPRPRRSSVALNVSRAPVGAPRARRSIRMSVLGLPRVNEVAIASDNEFQDIPPQPSTSQQPIIARVQRLNRAWNEMLKNALKNYMTKIDPTHIFKGAIKFNVDFQKTKGNNMQYYKIKCPVASCSFESSGRVGIFPDKHPINPYTRIENLKCHIRTCHPRFP